jgi:hypothetical protein
MYTGKYILQELNPDGHPNYPTCGQVKIPHLTAQISR